MGSMARVSVTKMHGTRNDFVLIDQRSKHLRDLNSFARWACDRRAGIGADGLLVLESSRHADVRMRTINADGSEAEMCGNGIRCAARWLDEAGEGSHLTFQTQAGTIRAEIVERGLEYTVRVAMGRPRIFSLELLGLRNAAAVDLGNPHAVAFCDDVDATDLEALAAQLQTDSRFGNGTNVHIAAVRDGGLLRVRHWERGVGLTMACGTGAVACAAVAVERRISSSPVQVDAPGGRLVVEWDGSGGAQLFGPAVRVFDAEVEVRLASHS